MRRFFPGHVKIVLAALLLSVSVGVTQAQNVDVANRPVSEVRIEGLKQVSEKLVRNNIRMNVGEPYDPKVVQDDIVRITYLNRFGSVKAKVTTKPDGTLILTYVVDEHATLSDVQVVGNKAISDQELLNTAGLKSGDPMDQYLIDRGIQEMKRAYEKKGYFVTQVTYDQEVLNESGVLLYKVREGPRPRIAAIRFQGNVVFTAKQLRSKIKSKTKFLFFRKGELNAEQLDGDAAKVREVYQERGYLDAQVGRRIDLSPDQKGAVVIFVVQEGRRYTVDKIQIEGNDLFTKEQIREAMTLKQGDIFSTDRLKTSQETLTNLFGKLGFIEANVEIVRIFHETQPLVDIQVKVREGNPYLVGRVSIKGNSQTNDKVIERLLRDLNPGERYDRSGMKISENKLKESPFFKTADISVQGSPNDPMRDAVVEVAEKNTGSLSFGAGVSSDAGVIGSIDLVQRNFDITDLPETPGEFFTGKAFRGAGQYFAISLQPGTEVNRYSVTFRDPYLFDTDFFMESSAYYYSRLYSEYSEQRVGATASLGHRFGDVWSGSVRVRGEDVRIGGIDNGAPVDIYDVEGHSDITSAGFYVTRNTTDSNLFPTRGNRLDVGISHAGAMGGNYTFDEVSSDFRQYWTVDEDFFGRRTVLTWRNDVSEIFDGSAPIFERLFAGGERSFRGFAFQGVSPRGTGKYTSNTGIYTFAPTSYPIGGEFMFLSSLEYNFPVFQDIVRVVFFTDTGTVQATPGFDQYRVSVGTGLRIKIPFLGQAPFALDTALPIIKQNGDKTQFFNFDLAVPF